MPEPANDTRTELGAGDSFSRKRNREGISRERTKRNRRDLETAIKRCLVAGLYMNAARCSPSFSPCCFTAFMSQAMC